jgi:hypothetical protein
MSVFDVSPGHGIFISTACTTALEIAFFNGEYQAMLSISLQDTLVGIEFMHMIKINLSPVSSHLPVMGEITGCLQRSPDSPLHASGPGLHPDPVYATAPGLWHLRPTTFTMPGTPFCTTYFWLRTITPTTAGLHAQYDKKQNQS